MEKFFENNVIKGWFEDGIMYAEFKVVTLDLAAAVESVKARLSIKTPASYPFLIDVRNAQSITKEARDYFTSDDGIKNVVASALIIESAAGRLVGNFFLQISRPRVPTRIFNNREDAQKWLEQYKNKANLKN